MPLRPLPELLSQLAELRRSHLRGGPTPAPEVVLHTGGAALTGQVLSVDPVQGLVALVAPHTPQGAGLDLHYLRLDALTGLSVVGAGPALGALTWGRVAPHAPAIDHTHLETDLKRLAAALERRLGGPLELRGPSPGQDTDWAKVREAAVSVCLALHEMLEAELVRYSLAGALRRVQLDHGLEPPVLLSDGILSVDWLSAVEGGRLGERAALIRAIEDAL